VCTGATCVQKRDKNAEKTMALRSVTAQEADQLLGSGDGYVYLDVRTPAEFQAGRPPGAINIPVAQVNARGQMELNDSFLSVVAANIAQGTNVLLGCRTGQRSAIAQEMLHQAGYTNTANVEGGFSGITDAMGHVVQEGWSTLGLPVERGDAGASSYHELQKKAKQ